MEPMVGGPKYLKSPLPGWFSVIAGAAWEALEHYDNVEPILPLPPWILFGVGVLWVVFAKRRKSDVPAKREPHRSEVVIVRERTVTVEREVVVRTES